jgi:glyoxylase-like metal-dependent hydrolase (beta-lactamase superfamily II)/rhodanese-related sulfurtransferase
VFVLLRQFVDDDLGCASYLIGDEDSGEAVLVDPAYAIEPFLDEAESSSWQITHVLETHTHADHVSGHGRLALEHGIPVSVHVDAGAAFEHQPLEDGDEIAIGSTTVRTLHTPGHRPEHCCFLAGDALLTGDSLFVGAAGRPDLAVDAREGAEGLYHSLHRLLELPDDVRVMPGHVAGSLCGTGMSAERASTIGQERRFNSALAIATVEEFVTESASITTPRPPNMERVVELNRGPFVGAAPTIGPAAQDGQFVLDVRDSDEHAGGHVAGAVNVPVSGSSFGTKAAFLVPAGAVIVLHAGSPEQAAQAAAKLHAVGFFALAGYLEDPEAAETLEPIEVGELEQLVVAGAVEVIDVREPYERDTGYIPGSRNIPYRVIESFVDDLADGRPIVTICESGARAAIAASVLAAHGVRARPVLHGGIDDWLARGGQLVEFRRCGS